MPAWQVEARLRVPRQVLVRGPVLPQVQVQEPVVERELALGQEPVPELAPEQPRLAQLPLPPPLHLPRPPPERRRALVALKPLAYDRRHPWRHLVQEPA